MLNTFLFRLILCLLLFCSFFSCSDARLVSMNLVQEAEQFNLSRRIVFFNGITDSYLLVIIGACSIDVDSEDKQLEVTCKLGEDKYKKHFLGLSDNVSYFVEQLGAVSVSKYRYKVLFKPTVIIPDVEIN